ncbi:hypothetical protein SNE35_22690 [Paucibacter sp. R3-3]|uniref:AlpA family phage regulatory protein n=1 Tax=Roseateles agri TaxID=3098619 RepID=A0ABU5DM14_9BURK|nr:AlpA family phage regulatory protein [Paucibacter sp. R3-3]MDY0747328.1 hypothetical protein [Paucibacter sp. R3-3]
MAAETIIALEPMFLAKPQAAAFLSVSLSTIDVLVNSGALPKPRKISANRTGWLVQDLREFALTRPVSDLAPPKGAGYGRAGKPSTGG